ncbi:MAG TPA: superoxide dismutase family protein [Paracoccus sp. (in: a-proteobacteria)]|nr:superoxide dismutase family protein [Paracoccus sp. (in: a-proteobacteria)]
MAPKSFALTLQPDSRMRIGSLLLGAALIMAPLAASAQTAAPAGDSAPAADAAAGSEVTTVPATESASRNHQAAAVLRSADGTEHGSVTASDTASGALHLILHLASLPNGPHAVHIHETGKCEGPTFESAGGHLAGGKEHGVMSANGMHPGDLPNVDAEDDGAVNQEFFLPGVKLADVMDDDGGAFIVHANADDYTSQPAGNAGDRIACGVFEATAPSN